MQWHAGSIKVTSVVEVGGPTPGGFLYAGLGPDDVIARAEAAPWLRRDFVDGAGRIDLAVQCLVVDTGDLRIAVDTCIGNHKQRAVEAWSGLDTPFLSDLAAAGYPAESIDVVVCTHLHTDHIGWNTTLVDDRWVPTFANARYVFARREYDYWRGEADPSGADEFGDSVAPVVDAGLVDLVDDDHTIADGVRLVPTPGHTPGHSSVEIVSGAARVVVTGDMTHSPLQIADPSLCSRFDTDPVAAAATRLSAFADWTERGTTVLGTHFGGPGGGRLVADGQDRWRLDPAG